MNKEGGFISKGIQLIILGVVIVVLVVICSLIPRREDNHDTWLVEVHVVEKAISEMDGEQVYVLRTAAPDGTEILYEINDKALKGNLDEETVYNEIKEDHYYKFRVAGKEKYHTHYPTVCGAVSLIEGFTPGQEASGN